jgi:bifunctional non-homologous end joining protein LigD
VGLESFVKSTGGKGLHVVVALEPAVDWVQLRLFARGVAAAIESTDPKRYLIKMSKAARKGRIFIDWMRNERGATAIAPWSPRARAGMRVAMPLEWSELAQGLPKFSVANLNEWRERVKTAGSKAKGKARVDPWAEMKPQRIRTSVLEAVLQAAQALEGAPKSSRR